MVSVSFLMLALSYPIEKRMDIRAFNVGLHDIMQQLWRSCSLKYLHCLDP